MYARPSGSAGSPGTTEAFEQANIYARASGYISKRTVDIGSGVKAGDLLVEITAPEVEHQIAQAEGTLAQIQASLQQAKANRDLAQVTWDRDSKLVQQDWVTKQQGDTDRLNLAAQEAAVAVAAANITAQTAQIRVLNQQKPASIRGHLGRATSPAPLMFAGSANGLDQQGGVFAKSWWWPWPENC